MIMILLVDDNLKIRKLMEIYLNKEGYGVVHAENGRDALDKLEENFISLIIVDIMMPEMDGFQLVYELRQNGYDLPILMITAKESFLDKKKGFEIGADDYMTKPVDFNEMLLRVNALLRRAKISKDKRISIGHIELNYQSLEVITEEKTWLLPKKEFYLLYKLLSYPNKIFTRQELMDEIWGFNSEADERTVDVHIKRLREKFSDINEFELITIRGLGYKAMKKV